MLLFLTVLQTLAHFCSQLVITKIASSILLMLVILAITSVGGYAVHIGEIPSYLWWSETFSPQRWLLPVIISNEFTQETLANTAGQQLCRNKHVSRMQFFKKLTEIQEFSLLLTGSKTRDNCATSMSDSKWDESVGRSLVTPRKSHSGFKRARTIYNNCISINMVYNICANLLSFYHKLAKIISKKK